MNMLKLLLNTSPYHKRPNSNGQNPNLNANLYKFTLPGQESSEVNQADFSRQSEILANLVTSTLLLLYKRLKLNHIYQAEAFSQQCVLANGIKLLLKILNTNTLIFISNKAECPIFNPPFIVQAVNKQQVIEEAVRIAGQRLFRNEVSLQAVQWRNMTTAINIARILNKFVAKHENRVMLMNVNCKNPTILRRVLKVKQANLQYYVLKLVKSKVKYLGKPWKKSNMRLFYAIYRMLRHRLRDDWAFANCDINQNTFNFTGSERVYSKLLCDFHNRRYKSETIKIESWLDNDQSVIDPLPVKVLDFNDGSPIFGSRSETNLSAVLENFDNEAKPLPRKFKKQWEAWVEKEVLNSETNWDQL